MKLHEKVGAILGLDPTRPHVLVVVEGGLRICRNCGAQDKVVDEKATEIGPPLPLCIPRFDEEWIFGGALIERFRISVVYETPDWTAISRDRKWQAEASTALRAVCALVVAMGGDPQPIELDKTILLPSSVRPS